MNFRSLAAFSMIAALATAPALAATKSHSLDAMGSMSMTAKTCAPPPRFGGGEYCGKPKLTNTLALVIAGGGPAKFSTLTLFGNLTGNGPVTKAEAAKLTKQYTAKGFKLYVKTFDFVINDTLKIVTAAKVALPKAPVPADPKDGKALATVLYADGKDASGKYSVEYMLDHLVSHAIHVQVMKDIDANPALGPSADGAYHVVTLQIIKDLGAAYSL